jgi:hypothetical protein
VPSLFPLLCWSCRTGPSPPATSPPVGTCRSRWPVAIEGWQGPWCKSFCFLRDPSTKDRDTPPLLVVCYFMCVYYCLVKFLENHRKIQKLQNYFVETRFQTLQLLFMKFDMKLNTFAPIFKFKVKRYWVYNFYISILLLIIFSM